MGSIYKEVNKMSFKKVGTTLDDRSNFTPVWECDNCGMRYKRARSPRDCNNCKETVKEHLRVQAYVGII